MKRLEPVSMNLSPQRGRRDVCGLLITLTGYELKKIWNKPLTWVTVLVVALLCGVDALKVLWTNGYAPKWEPTYQAGIAASWATNRMHTVASLLPFAIAVLLCGVFAEEGRNGVRPLICVTTMGRLPLAVAKILAGALSAVLLAATSAAEMVLLVAAVFGGNLGIHTPAQMYWDTGWAMTAAEVLLITAGLMLLYALLCTGFVMAVSALTDSSIAALTTGVLGESVLIYLEGWGDRMAWWMNLLPFRLLTGQSLNYSFPGPLNVYQTGFLLYGAIAAILLAACWPTWYRWAVARR